MISAEMTRLAHSNSAIRAMFEEGNRLAALYGRDKVYDFSLGNPNFPAPAQVKQAIVDVLDEEPTTFVHGYMPNSGYPDVCQTIADSLNRRFATSFGGGNILMTVGAAGGLNITLKTLLNPGDKVLTFAPYFLEYGNYVRNYGGVLTAVPADTATFQPNLEAFEAMLTPDTKAVIINTPNNPTGVIYSADTLTRLAAVLEKKEAEFGTSIYLISDEPYRELAYDGAQVPFTTKYYRNTIVGYSWSKSLSLPGERIGYLVIPSEIDEYRLIYDAAAISNRVLGFVNAPSLMQRVVKRCVDCVTDITPYDRNRRALYDGLTACGYTCVFPQGAFYMWMQTPTEDKAFVEAAKAYNILIVPGSSFACAGYVRIAYCVSPETIQGSLPGFRKLAEQFGLTK